MARGSPLVPNAKTWSLDRPALDETRVDAMNTQLQAEALSASVSTSREPAYVVYRLSLAGTARLSGARSAGGGGRRRPAAGFRAIGEKANPGGFRC